MSEETRTWYNVTPDPEYDLIPPLQTAFGASPLCDSGTPLRTSHRLSGPKQEVVRSASRAASTVSRLGRTGGNSTLPTQKQKTIFLPYVRRNAQ